MNVWQQVPINEYFCGCKVVRTNCTNNELILQQKIRLRKKPQTIANKISYVAVNMGKAKP